MLKNMNFTTKSVLPQIPSIQDMLAVMDVAPFIFFLTGSRFFSRTTVDQQLLCNNTIPDWDFFVGNNRDLRQFFKRYKFKIVEDESYKDVQGIVSVWRLVCSNGQIDIQVCDNPDRKQQIQACIKRNVRDFDTLEKKHRTQVWKDMYSIV